VVVFFLYVYFIDEYIRLSLRYPNKELTQDHRSKTQIKRSRTECVIIPVCIERIYTYRTNGK
jgi:hypothetical protein